MEIWVLLGLLALGWLISPIILLIAFLITRRQVDELRRELTDQRQRAVQSSLETASSLSSPPLVGGRRRCAPADLENLLLLRLELQRQIGTDALPESRYRDLECALDQLWEQHLHESGAQPENGAWRQRRALAWSLLAQWMDTPLGAPPWQPTRPEPVAPPVVVAVAPSVLPPVPASSPVPAPWSSTPVESPRPLPPTPPTSPIRRPIVEPSAPQPVEEIITVAASDWRPAPPSPLEKVLHVLSGWPKLIAPFLAQNIGWFIGGFCFVAGALFLIANTSGFINALVVFGSLFSATAFLLWAGYQFRRKRPELVVASSMLLTLAMLLAPLDLAVVVSLVTASSGDSLLLAVSVLIAATTLAAFAWAATLASALMDRALPGRYARLLTALTAVQLAAPLAAFMPDWRGLAAMHAVLLGLLGYGLWIFAREWLRRLFVDQRLTTYYAAGLLVYAATVSFVHLTWIWPAALPAGYAGPFLMALCGLLFPVDAAFKEWVNKYAFLSRFSFALYGLSVVAVAVAVQTTPAALLTLTLGAALYGWMTWQYRTLPPLYLLFGCVAGLYGFGILSALPPAWYGLASLPGLSALLGLSRWAGSRSRAIALQCLGTFGLLLIGLTSWSLIWTAPGWLGFATAALGALLSYYAVRLALRLPEADLRWAYADVGVVALALAAAAYAPRWTPFLWEIQTAYGLLALAALWTGLGLHDRRQSPVSRRVFVASALLNTVLALGLAGAALWPALLGRSDLILLLALAGALLLWLSLGLRQQALFYGVLIVAAVVGILIKHGYFPGPSTGLVEFALVLALWLFLWRLDWRSQVRQVLLDADADKSSAVLELASNSATFTALVRAPLEQAMALLWAVGLAHLSLRLLDGGLSLRWAGVAGLAFISGLLLIGYFHVFRWVALPCLLGLATLLVGLEQAGLPWPWLAVAAVLYALAVWRLSVALLAQPLTWRLAQVLRFTVPGGAGGRQQVEESLHYCALLVATVPVAASPALGLLGLPTPTLLPALLSSLLLFVLTGWRYRSAVHAYAALITLTAGVWLTDAGLTHPALFAVGQPLVNVVLSLVMAIAAVGLERRQLASLTYWRAPLYGMSGLLYALTLAGAVLAALTVDPRLPGLLALLCVALFPVARPWPNAADWRGLGLALLLSALVWSVAARFHFNLRDAAASGIGWGYVLWSVGNLLLPRWNARWPEWAVTATLWPWLGLVSVLLGGTAGLMIGVPALAVIVAWLALYLFLLLRNSDWDGLPWLAVAALTVSGLLMSDAEFWRALFGGYALSVMLPWLALALIWLNALFLLTPLWRWRGQAVARWLRWRPHDLETPLFWTPFAVLLLLLGQVLWLESGLLLGYGRSALAAAPWLLTGSAALLAATTGHACKYRLDGLTAHVVLLALGAVVIAALLDGAAPSVWLPLAAALWNGALLLLWRYGSQRWTVWRAALEIWLLWLPAAVIVLLFVAPGVDWAVGAATLLMLAMVTLAQGWWQEQRFWLQAGLALALAGSYALWLVGAAPFALTLPAGLAPWYALQTVLLMLALMTLRRRLTAWLDAADPEADTEHASRVYDFQQAVSGLIPWLLALTLFWLSWHGYLVLAYQAGWGASPWRFSVTADALAASATLLLLAGLTTVRAWRQSEEPNWVYATALLLGLLAGYVRLLVLGLTPFTVGDTTALMAAAYAAFLLHQFTRSRPLYRLALLLPLLALATAPWQLASSWAGGALLSAAVLYLSLAVTLRNPWPLYLGVLALNGAVYLWAPLWAARYGLWQFYIVPAAVSVLVLLHLHRRELRPRVLNGGRLAALSALYAGAGLDVFLRPELSIFVLALALALTGVILGIALRIRAFLYAGVAFLVLNVIGQLLRFYPEQNLSRALILLGLGTVITVGMVVFNLKREAILQRIRLIRADLEGWE